MAAAVLGIFEHLQPGIPGACARYYFGDCSKGYPCQLHDALMQSLIRVNNALTELQASIENQPIKVSQLSQLKGGSLRLEANSILAANWLMTFLGTWGPRVDPDFTPRSQLYKVVLKGLPRGIFDKNKHHLIDKICDSNNIDPRNIDQLHYSRCAGGNSMIICTYSQEIAKSIEQKGLKIEKSLIKCHRYIKINEQCEKCLKIGHHYYWCKFNTICERCGGGHWSHTCKGQASGKCHVCLTERSSSSTQPLDINSLEFNHSAYSNKCPTKLEAIQKYNDIKIRFEAEILKAKKS
ncbi:uncharacterized protein MELLADRAFT_104433 [Melampsora larici-populina 98AG31]|uniref:Uncharacterized protein n=1 Tax=Melampsora larici-populina (strain 98AG31 / pathotype 3-4-7) TaxID=747676 RepID=F4REP0_MELLP|nr:uncharacterized protein MELLADRAFT_104433 [Melampsora larici-populina 98AG31]EGG09133.1 hypothetical protein MELLADRAFT_104433 [Melampsora larici-populina 98AG31]